MLSFQKLLLTFFCLVWLSTLHAQISRALPPKINAEQPDWAFRGVVQPDSTQQPAPRKCFVLDIDTTSAQVITAEMISEAMVNKRYREVDCVDLKKKE